MRQATSRRAGATGSTWTPASSRTARRVKFGLVARNLFEPDFDTPVADLRLELARQVRAGAAVRATDELIVSLDADLTRSPDATGEWRSLAAGAEQRFWNQRAAVRGGFRFSTTGEARPILTTGGSISFRSGMFADGYVAFGLDEASPDGFGVGVRVTFCVVGPNRSGSGEARPRAYSTRRPSAVRRYRQRRLLLVVGVSPLNNPRQAPRTAR